MNGRVKILFAIPRDFIGMLVTYWPGSSGALLRRVYWRRRLALLGRGVRIDTGVFFQNPEFISIDDGAWIDQGVMILAGPDRRERERKLIENPNFTLELGRVHIGKRTHIAPYVVISGIAGVYVGDHCGLAAACKIYSFSHNPHHPGDPSNRRYAFTPLVDLDSQFMMSGPVFIGNNVGVGIHAIVLSGASIGPESFVFPNSVVMGKFEGNQMIGGSPAKALKPRFAEPKPPAENAT